MADRRRIVSISTSGTVATVLDLENGSTYQAVKDSFVVTPGARKTTMANQPRRYAGARPVAETHDNGTVEWKMLVSGATVTTVIANVEALLTQVESVTGLFLEWRPDGATSSVYYELRGSPSWKPSYSWAQMQGAGSMYIDLSFPVAPLARGDLVTISAAAPAGGMPAYYALGTAIPGDAPALVDVQFTFGAGAGVFTAAWALIAWLTRPPAAGVPPKPFGLVEVTTGSPTASAIAHGGSYTSTTTSGAGSTQFVRTIDATGMAADMFRTDTIDVEIWGRLITSALNLQGLKLATYFQDFGSPGVNQKQYTREYGSGGKSIGFTSGGAGAGALVRLGTVTLPVSPTTGDWRLVIDASWTGVSSGSVTWGVDYLLLVPARQRACGPTGKPLDSAYPQFIVAGAPVSLPRILNSDLSSWNTNQPGLGGSPIEMPPGSVDVCVTMSDQVPDGTVWGDPLKTTAPDLSLAVTPRYWLAKGT